MHSLQGTKRMEMIDLSGLWQCEIPGQTAEICLPGTLDESGIGYPDSTDRQWHPENASAIGLWQEGDPIVTRLTRRFTYEGPVFFSRTLDWIVPRNRRIFLECERARHLTLKVNGQAVPAQADTSISTPYVFELTGLMTGHDALTFISDNSYPGWPYEAITRSSAAADETQTNWNGILGYLRLRMEKHVFMQEIRVYPHGQLLDVCVVINAALPWHGRIQLASEALSAERLIAADVPVGITEVWHRDLPLIHDVCCWDEEEGYLYQLTASAAGLDSRTVTFGVRDFRAVDGRFQLNGRTVFLRSETNCAVFPEKGHPPMDTEAWKQVLLSYRSYGVNCMRFHSHCPPEAAFTAADELGMLMQPELSSWDPKNTLATDVHQRYYRGELLQLLHMLANHPSFVMLTLGNELRAEEAGHAFMDMLLHTARAFDPTRLYANGSNTHFGFQGHDKASDFYTAMTYIDQDLRATSGDLLGWLNQQYPDFRTDYSHPMQALRRKTSQPVFSFEVGQYEVLPDFGELDDYHGVTDPANLRTFRDRVVQRGYMPRWQEEVAASGELSLLCYRAEMEAALRTEGFSGISLLGLQDFPGQGTALIGMMNAHLKPKPFAFAQPERFRAFFRETLPLVLLPRCTWLNTETLTADVHMANYGRSALTGIPAWTLTGDGMALRGLWPEVTAQAGGLTDLGRLDIPLHVITQAQKLTLTIRFCGCVNSYSVWVYPDKKVVQPDTVHECRLLDDEALAVLASGGCVYLSPDATEEAMPRSVQCHFSPDFWNVCSFVKQSGTMGQLIDRRHPIFRDFPTDAHTDWQWWPMATQRAFILPENYQAIIAGLDSYAYLRPLAQLLECRCHGGRLLISSMGLQNLQQYPEARALLGSIYRYMASDAFEPEQSIYPEIIRRMIR